MLVCLLLGMTGLARGAEYQRNEQGTPTSASDVGSLLDILQPEEPERRRGIFSKRLRDWGALPQFLQDSTIDFKLRTYHIDQDLATGEVARATAIGGQLGLTTGALHGWQAGLGWYSAFEINSNANGAATGLLTQSKDDITVLGKAFVRYSNEGWQLDLFRQEIDLPYINKFDSRMVPNTFEAYSVARDGGKLDLFASHITDMKTRTDEEFRSMAEVAGANSDESASVVGALHTFREGVDVGAMVLNSWDLFRTIYGEANWFYQLPLEAQYKVSVQFTDQRSVGDELLGEFRTWTAGARGVLSYKHLVAAASFTQTSQDAGIKSPYGGRPSFNSLMILDFDRAGEKSWHAALSYEFTRIGVRGLGLSVHYGKGWGAENGFGVDLDDREEWDVTLEYKPDEGIFRGVWLRVRYATVDETGRRRDRDQLRVILNYTVPIS